MNKFYVLLLVFNIILRISFAQDTLSNKDTLQYYEDENGNKKIYKQEVHEGILCKGFYLNGKKNGEWICFYYKTDKIYSIQYYDNDSIYKEYYYNDDGRLIGAMFPKYHIIKDYYYQNSKSKVIHYEIVEYYHNIKVITKEYYKSGKLKRILIEKKGKIIKETDFNDFDGQWKEE